MSTDALQSLASASNAAFSALLQSTISQVSEIKSMSCLRGAGAMCAADIKALNQRAVSAEASLLELSVFTQGEEENLEALQVIRGATRENGRNDRGTHAGCVFGCLVQALVEQARELRDATAYMKSHLPFNLPAAGRR